MSRLPRLALLSACLLAGCGEPAPTMTPFGPDARCAAGGIELKTSKDTQVLCNGTTGAKGDPGDKGETGEKGDDGKPGVAAPVIQAIWVIGQPVAPGGTLEVHVSATVAEGRTASFTWSADSGFTIESGGTTAVATVRAPATPLAHGLVTVTVGDGSGATAMGVATVQAAVSDLPVIHAVSIAPQPIVRTGRLTVVVSDAGGTPPSAKWFVAGALVAEGLSVDWTHAGVPGFFEGKVVVSDADGNETSAPFTVLLDSDAAWPVQGRDAQSTERLTHASAAPTGHHLWTYEGPGMQNAPVIDAAGNVYGGSWDQGDGGFAFSVTPAGVERWKRLMVEGTTGSSDVFPAPVLANGTVYWSSWSGELWAADPATGAHRWSHATTDYNDNSSPIAAPDGTLYVGSMEPPAVFAVDPSGQLKWRFDTEQNVMNDLALAPDGSVVFIDSATLYVVGADGLLKWKRTAGTGNYNNLAIDHDGTIVVGTTGEAVQAFDRNGGTKWSRAFGMGPRGVSLGADGTTYALTDSGVLQAIDRAGNVTWNSTGAGGGWTTPSIGADGTIYYLSGTTLRAVRPDGNEKWSVADAVPSQGSGMAALGYDGRLYIPDSGSLHAFE